MAMKIAINEHEYRNHCDFIGLPGIPTKRRKAEFNGLVLLGNILTGNPWVFTIKLFGLSGVKISHHPIGCV